ASTTRSRRTRNPDPRKTKPHAHKNVGFVSNLRPFESNGLFRLGVAAVRVGSARPPRPGCGLGVSGN
ncbi:hypothetical protein, partial [Burkholderia pseudomallei]|uniref:hypothetical protein n=1 Tax=Burkholderia pseudomallei TaxID=28450 RepID=UPI001F31CB39